MELARSSTWIRAIGVAAAAASLTFSLTVRPSQADHGGWHHNNHWGESGTSQYWGYGHTKSAQASDFLFVEFWVQRTNDDFLVRKKTQCGPLAEGCSNEQTVTGYWQQGIGYLDISSYHCGKDGAHVTPDDGLINFDCGRQGVAVHRHTLRYAS